MPKSGKAHDNRKARAQGARDSNKTSRDARKELARPLAGKAPSPFGVRNKHLCNARKAQRTGDKVKADREVALATALAPLTVRERLNVERAHLRSDD